MEALEEDNPERERVGGAGGGRREEELEPVGGLFLPLLD